MQRAAKPCKYKHVNCFLSLYPFKFTLCCILAVQRLARLGWRHPFQWCKLQNILGASCFKNAFNLTPKTATTQWSNTSHVCPYSLMQWKPHRCSQVCYKTIGLDSLRPIWLLQPSLTVHTISIVPYSNERFEILVSLHILTCFYLLSFEQFFHFHTESICSTRTGFSSSRTLQLGGRHLVNGCVDSMTCFRSYACRLGSQTSLAVSQSVIERWSKMRRSVW